MSEDEEYFVENGTKKLKRIKEERPKDLINVMSNTLNVGNRIKEYITAEDIYKNKNMNS
eukprot:gene7763-12233_t